VIKVPCKKVIAEQGVEVPGIEQENYDNFLSATGASNAEKN